MTKSWRLILAAYLITSNLAFCASTSSGSGAFEFENRSNTKPSSTQKEASFLASIQTREDLNRVLAKDKDAKVYTCSDIDLSHKKNLEVLLDPAQAKFPVALVNIVEDYLRPPSYAMIPEENIVLSFYDNPFQKMNAIKVNLIKEQWGILKSDFYDIRAVGDNLYIYESADLGSNSTLTVINTSGIQQVHSLPSAMIRVDFGSNRKINASLESFVSVFTWDFPT